MTLDLVRLFTDPADSKGTGDVDDFIGIQVLCYYAYVADFDIEIIISGFDSDNRKSEFMDTNLYKLLNEKLKDTLGSKIKSRAEFESSIPKPKDNELNIWNAGVGKETIKYFQKLNKSTQTYSVQGTGFNDFNIVETLRIILNTEEVLKGSFTQSKQITNEHYKQLNQEGLTLFTDAFELKNDNYIQKDYNPSGNRFLSTYPGLQDIFNVTGNSSQDTLKKLPISNLSLYKNKNQEQLVVNLTMKLFGQAICLAGAPLCFWKGFFAFSTVHFNKFMTENNSIPKIENLCRLIYGKNIENKVDLGIGGGKGNNIKPFIKAAAQLEEQQINDLMNIDVCKYNVHELFKRPLSIMNINDKSLRFSTHMRQVGQAFEGPEYPAAIKGFQFVIRCFIYMFGDEVTQSCFPQVEGRIVGTHIFTFGSECVSTIKEAIKKKSDDYVFQDLPKFYSDNIHHQDGEKRLLALCLEETPPLWDGVNTLWSINKAIGNEKKDTIIDSSGIEVGSNLEASFNKSFEFESDVVLSLEEHKKKCCANEPHFYNGVNYTKLASCSVPDKDGVKIEPADCQQGGKGRKRTNKRIRKNKKRSLRKMKGGSKKANQKKVKLKKSRKA